MPRHRVVLFLSLLLNLFALGAAVGGVLVFWHGGSLSIGRTTCHPPPPRPLFDAGAALPPADHARFDAVLRDAAAAARPLRRDATRARRDAAALFEDQVFDRAAAAAALDRARTDDLALRQLLETAALDFAATLPADERVLLAHALARGGPLRHPHR